ncbi:MAG: DUF5058 family protein [Clostridia bacterium]
MTNTLLSAAFSLDSPIMYILYSVLLVFVVCECSYYMAKSIKRAKQIGVETSKIKKVITTSITFSILPSIGIAIGVVSLIAALGVAFPAIRLSVVGALHYESQMANGTAEALAGSMDALLAMGITAKDFVTMATVMTVSIMAGPLVVLFFYKRFQPKVAMLGKIKGSADGKTNLGDLVFQVVFIGMIIGYLGMSVASIAGKPTSIGSYYNFIAIVIAATCMYISEILIHKFNWKWLDSLSTPFSMLLAMIVVGIISFFMTPNGIA